METIELLTKEGIRNIPPYIPGNTSESVKEKYHLDHVLKLASNENQYGCSPKALEAMGKTVAEANIYPDPFCMGLRRKLGKKYGFDDSGDNVIISAGASGGFIFAIGITVILLLIVPLIMTFVSGFQGDKAHHEEKLEKVKAAAVEKESIVMEADRDRRKFFLRFPRKLFLMGTVLPLLVSVVGLALTRDYMYIGWVQGLRQIFMFFSAAGLLAWVPLLIYWADCSGTSLVMRIYLTPGQMRCYGYNGSMAERTEYEFALTDLSDYEVTCHYIKVRGTFDKKLKDRHGTCSTSNLQKTLRIPRVFPPEQERALLDYLYERKQIFP